MNRDENLLPHDIDAEEAVIGSILIDGLCIDNINAPLTSQDFYSAKCKCCYEAIEKLVKDNKSVNQITLYQQLVSDGKTEIIGGAAFISHLISICPTSVDIDSYAEIVYRLSMMRKLINAGEQVKMVGASSSSDLESSLAKAEEIIFNLRDNRSSGNFVHIRNGLDRIFDESTKDNSNNINKIPTGLLNVDSLMGGFYNGDLIILAGRPSMGKSNVALNIARNAAVMQKAGVAFFSIEMSINLLLIRLLANESSIPINISTGLLPEGISDLGEKQLMEAVGILSESNIWIDDKPSENIMDMRSKLRQLSQRNKINLVIVDHIGLVSSGSRFANRNEEVGFISKQLKQIAREFNVPVLALSQLNRGNESRSDKRPQLSDLRESGEIEQNADSVFFIYRDEYYYPTKEAWINANPDKQFPPPAELILSKNRNGATGTIYLKYEPNLYRFSSILNKDYD